MEQRFKWKVDWGPKLRIEETWSVLRCSANMAVRGLLPGSEGHCGPAFTCNINHVTPQPFTANRQRKGKQSLVRWYQWPSTCTCLCAHARTHTHIHRCPDLSCLPNSSISETSNLYHSLPTTKCWARENVLYFPRSVMKSLDGAWRSSFPVMETGATGSR